VLSRCLNMIVCALADMGGQIYSMELDMYGKKIISPDLEPTEIDIDYPYIRSKLGFKITDAEIDESLMKMGFGIKSAKSSKLKKSGVALVPCYRADILHQIDLVEDVAIGYGYENIPEHIPKVATIGKEDSFEILKRKISEILIGLNNLECKTYMIANKDYQTKKMNCNMDIVELSNALNEDYNVLNYWLIPQLFEVLKNNKHNEYPQNIYTISTVFSKEQMPVKSDTGMVETDKLALLLCSENSDYTRALQQFDYLMRMLGKKYELRQGSHDSFIPGRVSFAYVNGKNIGFIGEISIEVLRNWQIEMPVCGFEIDLNKLDS
jgi:phenylalanyl-tRNA synthetase beta chain